MKEIKVFLHRHRVIDVIHALKRAGFHNENCKLSIIDVKGVLQAQHNHESEYSTELGERIITEVKLELVCEDERINDAVRIIRDNARTGKPIAGWIFVSEITHAFPINGSVTEGK
jgi:nitrogen regulatory protein P-II 1